MFFTDNHAIKRLLRASLCYHFLKKAYKYKYNGLYIIKPGILEYALWNEVWASSELTEGTVQGDFCSMPPKQIVQGLSQTRFQSFSGYKVWGQCCSKGGWPQQLGASQGLCLPDNITGDTEKKEKANAAHFQKSKGYCWNSVPNPFCLSVPCVGRKMPQAALAQPLLHSFLLPLPQQLLSNVQSYFQNLFLLVIIDWIAGKEKHMLYIHINSCK